MKGIILAGGKGSRLHPITHGLSKQLLPVYDKPMIYYSLSILMLSGIKDILIITTDDDLDNYQRALGQGKNFGINLSYAIQTKPRGIADAFVVGANFVGNDKVCLVLGDNLFYGLGLVSILKKASKLDKGAKVFGYQVKDPENFGVVEFNQHNHVISVEEKPTNPKSNIVLIGLYFFDNQVIEIVKKVKPSERNEIEIISILQTYLEKDSLDVEVLGRGFAWLDSGTPERLFSASRFVEVIQTTQAIKIACLEEIAFSNGWLNQEQLKAASEKLEGTDYGRYIESLLK